MSRKAIDGFFAKVSNDETLQRAVQEAYKDGVNAGAHAAVVGLGAESGFAFSAGDLEQAWADQKGELSDEQLDGVAGGWCVCNFCAIFSVCGGGGDSGGGGSTSSAGGGGNTSSSRA